jgi:hypothetical protein
VDLPHLQTQFKRLSRSHAAALDNASDDLLLDLAHILRIWADMKGELRQQIPEFRDRKAFTTRGPSPKLRKAVKSTPHWLCYLGTPLLIRSWIIQGAETGDFTVSASFRSAPDGAEVEHIGWVGHPCSDEERRLLNASSKPQRNNVDYVDWLGGEVVRLGFIPPQEATLVNVSLTRERLIRRASNVLGGSHPMGDGSNTPDSEKRYDEAVRALLNTRVGGYPAAYVILLHCAQEILRCATGFPVDVHHAWRASPDHLPVWL